MGRTKRLYPLGKYRLRLPKNPVKDKAYPVDLEYTWNRKVIRKTSNVFVKIADWNQNLHAGRGGVRPSYGSESKRINSVLLARVERIDSLLAEYAQNNPNQITEEVIDGFLLEKPVAVRKDNGKDFVDFVIDRLDSEYSRNRIGRSRYENGKSGMNMFKEFLRSKERGTYKSDGIYLGEISVELLEEYIEWRRDIKQNSDHTINHALTPILKACAYAAELHIIDVALNARIQDMRIAVKPNLSGDESAYDGKSLSKEELAALIEYYHNCKEARRKEYLEMFLFAFHACGLRVVDVMTLQWSNIDFEKKELRKIMIKTGKRHIIPLSDPAIEILEAWKEKHFTSKFVFNLVKDDFDIDNDEALYKVRNSATRGINQSLVVVGEDLELKFPLTMHVARHTFAVYALNEGLSMSVVSRLLGHGSTDVTEKVYAKFLPETLSSELNRLSDLSSFRI
jgi:integrase